MTPTLADETACLIRAEALLAERVPTMRTRDRMALLIELRDVLEGRA